MRPINCKRLMPPGEYVVSLLCYMGSVLIASCMFWTSPLVDWLSSEDAPLRLNNIQTDWAMSIIEVSCLVSVLPLAFLANKIGRRKTLFIAYPVAITSFVLALFVNSYATILIVRLLQGVTIGILLSVGPQYAGETLRNDVRGIVIASFNVMFSLSTLVFSILGSYLSYTAYCVVCLIVPFLGLVLIGFTPETPHCLIMKNEREKALETLKWLRGSSNVEDEMNTIERNVQEEMTRRRGFKYLMTTPEERRTLTIGLVIMIGSSVIGYPVIPTYAFNLFPPEMSSAVSSTSLGFIINGVTAFGGIVVALLVDRMGRRPLLILSCLANSIFSLACAIYLTFESQLPQSASYSLLAFVVLFTFFISWIQSLQVVSQSELFTSNTRTESSVILQFFGALFSLLLLVIYPLITEYCGISVNFFLFTAYSVLFLTYLWFYMPETAGQFIGHKVYKEKQIDREIIEP